MNNNIKTLFAVATMAASMTAMADAKTMCEEFNASKTPAQLVDTGWAANNGSKSFKTLQVVVDDEPVTAEMRIDATGKCIASFDSLANKDMDSSYDYVMSADMEDWADMATGDNGPMYHMSWLGGLSFKGPYGEAMANMGPFGSFLVNIGKNIQK